MLRPQGIIVAIDGPSGAGKSTVAKQLAERIGYTQIDTGAMYRAAAFLISQAGINPDDLSAIEHFCASMEIHLDNSNGKLRVVAAGQDVTEQIRTPEMSLMTSRISALGPVRESLMKLQRQMGCSGGVVLEGRDIGTVVFPDAELKFFLFASPEERGRRRFVELSAKGVSVSLQDTIDDVVRRDQQDSCRELAPLCQAEDAIPVDSSNCGIEDVLDKMEALVQERISKNGVTA